MKKLEAQNTLVFITDVRANKNHIARAVERLYEVKAAKINTLVRCVGGRRRLATKGEDKPGADLAPGAPHDRYAADLQARRHQEGVRPPHSRL